MNELLETISWSERWAKGGLSTPDKFDMLLWLYKREMKTLERFRSTYAEPNRPGFDSRQVQRLAKIQKKVLKLAMEISRPDLFPFVPVLPKEVMQTFDIIMKLSNSGERWSEGINLSKVEDAKRKPARPVFFPYFLFIIDDGKSRKGLSPNESVIHIVNKGFLTMNLTEALQYLMHSNSLDQPFSVHACGARNKLDKNSVPGLIKDQGGPRLTWSPADQPKVGWTCPSYQTFRRAASLLGFISPKVWIRMGAWERIRSGFFPFRKPPKADNADVV